jgi:cation diffusion facilitator CzcD-associated flavoprotein CzcO
VPTIASEVAHLTVFQRNAAWVSDRFDFAIPPFLKKMLQQFPILQKLVRARLFALLEFRGRLFIGNAALHKFFTNLSLKKLNREVHDPELRRKLTPAYQYGCKRILVSDDYWPTFNRPNVRLETASIAEITPNGVRTSDGKEHHVDAIIFATGFEVADFTTEMKIIGRNGRELFSEWRRASLEAYKGTTISGFPNFTFLLGPNTGLGHSSVLQMMEAQMNYVIDYISLLESQGGKAYLDVKPTIQRAYNETLQRQFEGTVWASGCKSWYINSNGKITTLYPRLLRQFRRETAQVDAGEYELVQAM